MDNFIPLSVPNLKGNEQKYVSDAISREWVSTGGEYITKFEKRFAEYAGVDDAVACQSGTAGLHLSLILCGVGVGDLVIVPTLTFVASVNPIVYMGAQPVFMDCDDSLCMDMDKLEQYLSEECVFSGGVLLDKTLKRPVKAIVVVHIFGNCANMEKLMSLAEKYGLTIIEDAAEAIGTFYTSGKYAGKMLGTIGDIGVYSFNGNKIITTGGGGMVVSNNPSWLAKTKHLSTQAKVDEVYFVHDEVGYNYRMTNLQAAMGVAQLEQLEDFISTKRKNYQKYIDLGLILHPFDNEIRPNYWFYSYLTKNRDELIDHLTSKKIQSRPVWHLIHNLPFYQNAKAYRIDKAWDYWDSIVNIPCSSNLTEKNIMRVAEAIFGFEGRG